MKAALRKLSRKISGGARSEAANPGAAEAEGGARKASREDLDYYQSGATRKGSASVAKPAGRKASGARARSTGRKPSENTADLHVGSVLFTEASADVMISSDRTVASRRATQVSGRTVRRCWARACRVGCTAGSCW